MRYPKSNRITIVLPFAVLDRIRDAAMSQGRSVSNLCAYLLETALRPSDEKPQ